MYKVFFPIMAAWFIVSTLGCTKEDATDNKQQLNTDTLDSAAIRKLEFQAFMDRAEGTYFVRIES